MRNYQVYRGQTLAIVMVILIAVVVIALGIYSQIVRNQERVFQERASKEAGTYTDSIVDALQSMDVQNFVTNINGQECWEKGECCYEDLASAENLVGVDLTLLENEQTPREIKFCISKKLSVSTPENLLKEKNVIIPFVTGPDLCDYTFNFTGNGAVIVNKLYVKYDGSGKITGIKPYDSTDIVGIKVGAPSNGGDYSGNWVSSNNYSFTNEPEVFGADTYELYEVIVKSIDGDISYVINNDAFTCTNYLAIAFQITSEEDGLSQSSYFELPLHESIDDIFSYVLYNNNGLVKYIKD